jgi:hypothetical protein
MGWLKGGDINEPIFIIVMYTFGVGMIFNFHPFFGHELILRSLG